MTVKRTDPPGQADERTSLMAFLDFHRDTLMWKCEGLRDEQLRERPVPPSTMSLLGLVRHLTDVERGWFVRTFGGEPDAKPLYYSDSDPDGDFDNTDTADVTEAFATWRSACEQSREIVKSAPSLDDAVVTRRGETVSLRWIMLHMIEEYARHNGHADLFRERIDGATGE
jgi:uncharacterized damage-inducible protein DinB